MSKFIFTPIQIIPALTFFTFVEESSPIAKKIAADYIYDPEHKHKPKGGNWFKTEKGWSDVNPKASEFTFSPEVNVGGFDEAKTKENISLMKPKISDAILKATGRQVPFEISPRKAGRYMEYSQEKGMDILYKEASYSFAVEGLSQEEANKTAKELANNMHQSSVLVWSEENKKSRLVFRDDEKFEGWDFDFEDKSVSLFLSGNSPDDIGKIDNIIQSVMKGKTTGWTIAPLDHSKTAIVDGKEYVKMSNAITMHGLKEEDVEKLANQLNASFHSKVLVVDLKSQKERIVG